MDTALVHRVCELRAAKSACESEARRLASEISEAEAVLIPQFEADGVQSVRTDAGATLYVRKQLWAKRKEEGVSNEDIVRALQGAGLGEFATANWTSLSALLRERGEVPEAIANVIDIEERFSLGVRGAR